MRRLSSLWLLAATLAGCGGGGSDPGPAPAPETPTPPVVVAPAPVPAPAPEPATPTPVDGLCSTQQQQQRLLAYMQQNYYWHGQMPAGDPSLGSLDAYFQSLLNKPTDRFSFTQPTAGFDQFYYTGHRVGYGYTLVWDSARQLLQVRSVEPLSPVGQAGLRRGDTVFSIDGKSPAQVLAGDPAAVSVPGIPRKIEIRDGSGVTRTLQVVSADFAVLPVAQVSTVDVSRKDGTRAKVGYLAYNQFVFYTDFELRDAFDRFRAEGVTELVLDLRYNGGGSVAVSRDVASYIGGALTAGKVFARLQFNELQIGNNFSYPVLDSPLAPGLPGLKRLFVIGSGATASASELLINALRPFMPVVLVGQTTYGKPYGFVPRDDCGITYNAVNFQAVNSQGEGDFTSGFAPQCAAEDDLAHELGDPAEGRLRVSLNYIANGVCGPLAAQGRMRAPSIPLGEVVPPGMFIRR